MKLYEGETAAGIIAKDIWGNVIDLKSYRGRKVLLSFYRGASCPFCNLRVREVIQHVDKFREKGLEVIAFFTSEKEEILEYAEKQNSPFPIIADPGRKFYALYGLEKSLAGKLKAMLRIKTLLKIFTSGLFTFKAMTDDNTLPGDFLINENGFIEQAYYGKDFGDHLSLDEINKWINN